MQPAAALGEQISGPPTSGSAGGQMAGGTPAGPDEDTLTRRSQPPPRKR